ncbi:MAG: ComF family protein [Paludibacteraceae bacterium]|nr:ComF family protein [Paludibacteraceae bacterium]
MITDTVARFLDYVGSALFPTRCPICGKRTETIEPATESQPLCRTCLRLLPRTEHAAQRNNRMEDLFYRHRRLVRAGAFLHYSKGSTVQYIVEQFKYHEQPQLAYQLGKEAAIEWMQSDFFDNIDLLVPIPLHPRRLRERGYNQSAYIARAISEVTGLPVVNDNLLRVRNNPKQALKSGKERKENVKDVFEVKQPALFAHKHLLLIDDIVTTGSTLLAAMNAIDICRGCHISLFAIAQPQPENRTT